MYVSTIDPAGERDGDDSGDWEVVMDSGGTGVFFCLGFTISSSQKYFYLPSGELT